MFKFRYAHIDILYLQCPIYFRINLHVFILQHVFNNLNLLYIKVLTFISGYFLSTYYVNFQLLIKRRKLNDELNDVI